MTYSNAFCAGKVKYETENRYLNIKYYIKKGKKEINCKERLRNESCNIVDRIIKWYGYFFYRYIFRFLDLKRKRNC